MKKYQTILADPPWQYGKGWGWGAGKYYSLMTIKEIKQIKIPSADNAHLYLWCPNGMLPIGLRVMKEWDFDYKTCITWVKHRSIFGYYFKGQTEQLLFGVKGKLPPQDRHQVTVVFDRIQKHSQKPQQVYSIIKKVSPYPRLELFARQKTEGWTSVGYDIDGMDIKESLDKLIRCSKNALL